MAALRGIPLQAVDDASDEYAELIEEHLRRVVNAEVDKLGEVDVVTAQGSPAAVSPDDLGGMRTAWRRVVDDVLVAALVGMWTRASGMQAARINAAVGEDVAEGLSGELLAAAFVAGARNRLVDVGDRAWEEAREQLAEGVRRGESVPALAARVREAADLAAPQASVVARTETVSAFNAASITTARSLGVELEKQWIATNDARTRDSHRAADGQRVALGEAFTVGGAGMDHPGDPSGPPEEVVNCRCTVGYEIPAASVNALRSQIVAASAVPVGNFATIPPEGQVTPMPWHIERDADRCSDSEPWAVIKNDDNSIAGCHSSRDDAVAQLRALEASEAEETAAAQDDECPPGHHRMPDGTCMRDEDMNANGVAVSGVAVLEGAWTGDGRQWAAGSITWPDLAETVVPLQWQKETNHGSGRDVAVNVGRVTHLERDGDKILTTGVLDTGSADGAELARRIEAGNAGGVSIVADDPESAEVELVFPEGCDPDSPEMECMFAARAIFHSGRIRALTFVDTPAFVEASVNLDQSQTAVAAAVPDVEAAGDETVSDRAPDYARLDEIETLVAASHSIQIPDTPPADWFDEPEELPETGAIKVTDDGRVYGLLAPKNVAHRSFGTKRVTVPMGNVDYSRWMNRETICDGGKRVATGPITLDCGHAQAASDVDAEATLDHYDNSCSIVATVRVGENEHGVWVAGALLPDVTPGRVARMLACQLSGDWRPHREKRGMREMCGALLVPVPGFPRGNAASVRMKEGQLTAASAPVSWEVVGMDVVEIDATGKDTDVETETAPDPEEPVLEPVPGVFAGLPSWEEAMAMRDLRVQLAELDAQLR